MKPNIVFITTDTQGQNMVSAYGKNPAARTPSIDRLAEEGVLFENSYCSTPVCTPARSTWYTGLPPNRNGAMTNDIALFRHIPMLAELLGVSGYDCYHLGKWHLDAGSYAGRGFSQAGFNKAVWYDQINFIEDVGKEGINRFGGWNKGLDDPEYCFAHRTADRAIDVMKSRNRSQPLYLAVDFDEPHGPYICPPPFRGRNHQEDLPVPETFRMEMGAKPQVQKDHSEYLAARRPTPDTYPRYYHKYYDCNEFVDSEIGRVVEAAVEQLGENTVFIYTSDHGDHLGHFGLQPKGPTMYEATTAVPLIISGAGIDRGVRSQALVSSHDIWATVLEIAEAHTSDIQSLKDPAYWGRSLRPALSGGDTEVHKAVFIEYNRFGIGTDGAGEFFPIRCVRSGDWKLSVN
ncbi:MAG: sulfatase-like hydrolase/transferase, partial [Spirochaetales bacterium]|nr:sulfatase-like hydrolase/transferase [Spirochaetales bacterium]